MLAPETKKRKVLPLQLEVSGLEEYGVTAYCTSFAVEEIMKIRVNLMFKHLEKRCLKFVKKHPVVSSAGSALALLAADLSTNGLVKKVAIELFRGTALALFPVSVPCTVILGAGAIASLFGQNGDAKTRMIRKVACVSTVTNVISAVASHHFGDIVVAPPMCLASCTLAAGLGILMGLRQRAQLAV